MEQHSLDHVNPSQLKNYFWKLCLVSGRYGEKHYAMKHLHTHLDKLKSHPAGKKLHPGYVTELKARVNRVLEADRKILGSIKPAITREMDHRLKIYRLEEELRRIREEKNHTTEENKKKIDEVGTALLSIKTRLNDLLQTDKKPKKRRKK